MDPYLSTTHSQEVVFLSCGVGGGMSGKTPR